MRPLMIAPPGAGKGTQDPRIAAHAGIRHIGTGDLLRSHVARGTALGRTEHRSEDAEPVIRPRLPQYHQTTKPILHWYAQRGILLSVDRMRTADQVTAAIIDAIGQRLPAGRARPDRGRELVAA